MTAITRPARPVIPEPRYRMPEHLWPYAQRIATTRGMPRALQFLQVAQPIVWRQMLDEQRCDRPPRGNG